MKTNFSIVSGLVLSIVLSACSSGVGKSSEPITPSLERDINAARKVSNEAVATVELSDGAYQIDVNCETSILKPKIQLTDAQSKELEAKKTSVIASTCTKGSPAK